MKRILMPALLWACAGCAEIPAGSRAAPELQPLFDDINARAFGGRLFAELRTVDDPVAYGRTRIGDGCPVIALDSTLCGDALRAVMAHEMVHLHLSSSGNFLVRLVAGSHGSAFADECRRVAGVLGMPVEALTDDPHVCECPSATGP